MISSLKLEKIKHGFKTLAECGGIRGVDDTSSLLQTVHLSMSSDTVAILDASQTY
jgi:hypothetical protein